jgi:hypothetical protein
MCDVKLWEVEIELFKKVEFSLPLYYSILGGRGVIILVRTILYIRHY